jgi:hypothetical protein
MMSQHFSGTIAFTALTHTRASALPSVSIALAARSTISRIASTSMRARDSTSMFLPRLISFLPKPSRLTPPVDHHLDGPLGRADRPHAVVDAARSEPHLGDLEAASLTEQDVVLRAPARR